MAALPRYERCLGQQHLSPGAVIHRLGIRVAAGAIPWLLLPVAGKQVGPTGGDELTKTTYIQRLNTAGGIAPAASTCAAATDAGKKALVDYSADYFFYKAAK